MEQEDGMSDLIDRGKLKERLFQVVPDPRGVSKPETSLYMQGWNDAITSIIENEPSAETKKGRWIFARYYVWECSECGKNPTKGMGYVQRNSELFRYCPNCGSEMEVTD